MSGPLKSLDWNGNWLSLGVRCQHSKTISTGAYLQGLMMEGGVVVVVVVVVVMGAGVGAGVVVVVAVVAGGGGDGDSDEGGVW